MGAFACVCVCLSVWEGSGRNLFKWRFLRNFFKYTFNYALGILKFDSILFDNVLVTKVYWNEWYPIPKYREMSILKVDQVLQTGLQVVTLCNQGNDIK